MLVIGLCGPQGSGKSTATADVSARLRDAGWNALPLSLDDLYLTREERLELARSIHPLLASRGVPGTHDLTLGHAVLDNASRSGSFKLPSFDKAIDDRAPKEDWPEFMGPADVILLEGWCIGARPQPDAELAIPVNRIERDEDSNAKWRNFVNRQLKIAYADFFGCLDHLILLAPSGFEVVAQWRQQQEETLRAKLASKGAAAGNKVMTDAEVGTFILYYERVTRHILLEMSGRADMVLHLNEFREVTRIRGGGQLT